MNRFLLVSCHSSTRNADNNTIASLMQGPDVSEHAHWWINKPLLQREKKKYCSAALAALQHGC